MTRGAEDPTADDDLLADLFDTLLQEILEGRTPDIAALHPDRPDLRERIRKTWSLACSVAGRREPSQPVFGGYEVVRELGHGGMGTVYLARHETLQREVALKVLPHSLAMSTAAKQRFLEEARALAQLRHEHVVHVHRVVDHAEMLAFEMEYVDGPSLQRLLVELREHERPQSIEAIAEVVGVAPSALGARSAAEWFVRVAIRIARALGAVHRAGLVHRDVKPANILLRRNGTPLLADFGLALAVDLEGRGRKFAGTPVYAAPERLRGDDAAVDARSDVYSLGVTLYEALSLNPPFHGSSTHEVLRRIDAGATTPLRARAPHVSQDLATIVQKAMEPAPEHRYATTDALADDLQRLLDLQPIVARPAGPVRRFFKFLRRHQKATIAAVAGAAIVALAVWPLAAMAANREAGRREAAEARHAARTQLLCQESLPPSWWYGTSAGATQLRHRDARLASLDRALALYEHASSAAPADALEALEELAVATARARLADDAGEAKQAPTGLPPLLAAVAAPRQSWSEGTQRDDRLGRASPEERFAAGLFAFLVGDRAACVRCWQDLPAELAADPLVDAATALQLAAEGHAAPAYPRMFHAARTFPGATALVVAMADGAVQSGDLQLAHTWLDAVPVAEDPLLDAGRRLVAADLLSAEGQTDEAARRYREIVALSPTDPRPVLRLAELARDANNLHTAERLWHSLLRRWPGLAPARYQLARLALQRHDVPGYLEQVRGGAARDVPDDEFAALLRLAGLQLPWDLARTAARPPVTLDPLPLGAWLPRARVEAIERALELRRELDRLATIAQLLQPRPVGTEMLTAWLAALRFPDAAAQLPAPARALVLALPLLAGPLLDPIARRILPFQTVLGSELHAIGDQRLFRTEGVLRSHYYGAQLLRLDDADGDTLPEICIAAPPLPDVEGGRVELRSLSDGGLLQSWSGDAMFGRAIACLGDVDGDLCDDLLVGTPAGPLSAPRVGRIELLSGRTGMTLWSVQGEQASFGATIAGLGDIDGDAVPDFVCGASPDSLDGQGVAWVRSGRDGRVLTELRAPRSGVWFGGCVARAGDVDGDGDEDVLVGGNFGDAPGVVVAFDARTGHSLLRVEEQAPQHGFANLVCGLGDVDRDGAADIAIAASGSRGAGSGRVLVVSSRTGTSLYELRGDRPGDGFGASVCALPDWRGDGRPALAVAALRGGPLGSGYVRVFDLGSAAPLQTFAGGSGHAYFGYCLVDLGDMDGDGMPDLGGAAAARNGDAELWIMSFGQLPAEVRRGLRRG